MNQQTLLIGLDGATFRILDPLMQQGITPFLKEFIASGVRAELRSVIPALTPPAWASLTTGRSPGHHGIFDFLIKDSPASHHFRIASARDLRAETVWSIADRNGLRTTALNFPLMFPPPKINGYVVPGWMPWRQIRLGCHPEGLYDRLKALPGFDSKELAMDLSPEAKVIQGCGPEEFERWIDFHIRRERQWFRVLTTLMREDPCHLTAVVFDGVDKIQHLCWRFLEPESSSQPRTAWADRIRRRCLDYFRELDGFLAEIAGSSGGNATVVLASDHGFGPQTGTFFVNAWLEKRGYLAWANGRAPISSDPQALGIDQLARHVYLLDWKSTKAYAPTPSGNGIHIVVAERDSKGGIPGADYHRFRNRLAEELRGVRDPTTGEPVISRVWTREEVFAGPHQSLAPDLTLVLSDGGLVSILASEVPFQPRAEASGAHRPEGIFVARGPGVRQGARLPQLSILDVAPLLLYRLNLEVPADMEGKVPAAAFEPRWLSEHPVRYGPPSESGKAPTDTGSQPVFTREDQIKLAEHLRSLGYIE